MNRVIAHFNWRSKGLSNSMQHSRVSSSSISTCAVPAPSSASIIDDPVPTSLGPQLHSTRQRVESESALTCLASPIARIEEQASISKKTSYLVCYFKAFHPYLDATLPPTLICSETNCSHVIEYGKHFDRDDWARWTSTNDTVSGRL